MVLLFVSMSGNCVAECSIGDGGDLGGDVGGDVGDDSDLEKVSFPSVK